MKKIRTEEKEADKSNSEPEYTRVNEPIFSENFYAIFSLILIWFMFIMLISETVVKYKGIQRNFTVEMSKYFDRVGYVMIIYMIFCIIMFIYEYGLSGIKVYFIKNKHDILFLIFLIYSFVAAVLSDDKDTAFFGHIYRDSGFISYLMYAATYICARQICYITDRRGQSETEKKNGNMPAYMEAEREKKEKKGRIIKLCLYFMYMAVCTFQNTLLIRDYFGYKGSDTGSFYNTNHSAYFMVISIFAMIGYASVVKNIVLRILGYEMYAINLWCLIINDTLGAYLAIIFGLIFMAVLYFIKYKKIGMNIIISIAIFIVISVAVDYDTHIISNNFGVLSSDTKNISEDTDSTLSKSAGSGRWDLWLKGAAFVKKHPIVGCGPDCMPIDTDTGDLLILPHNEYLQYAMEIGTPASLCYIAGLILLFITRLKKLKRTDDSVIYDCCVVAAYCASAFFGINMFYTFVYYCIFLGITNAKYYS